jgi:hypothetical protein
VARGCPKERHVASNGKFSKTISPKKTLKKETVFLALALLPVITKTISKQ